VQFRKMITRVLRILTLLWLEMISGKLPHS
jgi:hypothetical protein